MLASSDAATRSNYFSVNRLAGIASSGARHPVAATAQRFEREKWESAGLLDIAQDALELSAAVGGVTIIMQ
ncbi:hypothetical protein GALL_547410 [mine drainage metagenome]|uniref:Uncharacterized protein n=1 Tax=mine drainage metagenome TaxID=410659 RepID=A0A1J5PJK4_9ZZZZ